MVDDLVNDGALALLVFGEVGVSLCVFHSLLVCECHILRDREGIRSTEVWPVVFLACLNSQRLRFWGFVNTS